jgi:hypothetical protein
VHIVVFLSPAIEHQRLDEVPPLAVPVRSVASWSSARGLDDLGAMASHTGRVEATPGGVGVFFRRCVHGSTSSAPVGTMAEADACRPCRRLKSSFTDCRTRSRPTLWMMSSGRATSAVARSSRASSVSVVRWDVSAAAWTRVGTMWMKSCVWRERRLHGSSRKRQNTGFRSRSSASFLRWGT